MTDSAIHLGKPDGSVWAVTDGPAKLTLRATLPGARVFDLAAQGLRAARQAGVSWEDRLALALPASWCVNSPADSRVFRRWTLPPQRAVWEALIDLFEELPPGPIDGETRDALLTALPVLAPEPRGMEAVSKVLAALVPDAVPLMPEPARAFLLGPGAPADAASLVSAVAWFRDAVAQAREPLAAWAAGHAAATLTPAQVLDRLLWFDSEGHRHFPGRPAPL